MHITSLPNTTELGVAQISGKILFLNKLFKTTGSGWICWANDCAEKQRRL